MEPGFLTHSVVPQKVHREAKPGLERMKLGKPEFGMHNSTAEVMADRRSRGAGRAHWLYRALLSNRTADRLTRSSSVPTANTSASSSSSSWRCLATELKEEGDWDASVEEDGPHHRLEAVGHGMTKLSVVAKV